MRRGSFVAARCLASPAWILENKSWCWSVEVACCHTQWRKTPSTEGRKRQTGRTNKPKYLNSRSWNDSRWSRCKWRCARAVFFRFHLANQIWGWATGNDRRCGMKTGCGETSRLTSGTLNKGGKKLKNSAYLGEIRSRYPIRGEMRWRGLGRVWTATTENKLPYTSSDKKKSTNVVLN